MTPHFPPHQTMPGSQLLFTALNFGILLIVAALLVRNCRKHRDWLPAWLLIGGLIATLIEPVVDVVGLIWYPPQGNWAVLYMGGITVPLLCVAGYTWLYAALGGATYILLRNGANRSDLFKGFFGLMVFLMLVEFLGSGTGVYYYYGDQPLRIFGYVAYWGFINASVPVIIGVVSYLLRPHVTGWRMVFSIPVVPFVTGASFLGGGFPVWLAIYNAPLPWVVTQLAGVVTCLLCTGGVWIATRAAPVQRTTPGTPFTSKTVAAAQPQR
jgi:hypothetical protein